MSKKFTAPGNLTFSSLARGQEVSCATQATAGSDNHTWEIQFSLDGGTTWTAHQDGAGNTSFTGSGVKTVRAASDRNRVVITGMGGATEVWLGAGA